MKQGKRSAVWVHFHQTDARTVTCKICRNNLKYHGNTSNMREHIKRRHKQHSVVAVEEEPIEIKNEIDIDVTEPYSVDPTSLMTESTKTRSLSSADSPPGSPRVGKRQCLARPSGLRELTTTERELLDVQLVRMICKDFQQVAFVEDKGFSEFVTTLQPLYTLPSRKTLTSKILPKLYESTVEMVEKRLEQAETVSLSTEVWTNTSNNTFLTMTAHYALDDDERMYSNVLETKQLEYNHTSEDIATEINTTLIKWNLIEKVVAVVTDNSANVQKAVSAYLKKHHHLGIAQILDLIFSESLENNSDLVCILEKCKRIVDYFQTNVAASENLRSVQRQLQLPELKVKKAETNHWSPVLTMLERLSEIKVPLSIATSSEPVHHSLEHEEWTVVAEIVSLLKPFNEMAEELSRERYSTMSKVIPMLRGLQSSLSSQNTQTVTMFQNTLIEVSNNFLDLLETNEQVAKSTFLDPRFKKAGFGIAQSAENAEKLILEEIREEGTTTEEVSGEKQNESSLIWSYFDEKVRRSQANNAANTTASLLVRQYLDLPLLNRSKDPFDFWRRYKHSFAALYKLFLKYGSIPATFVPSERVFTKDGQRLDERRKCLSQKNLNQIVFLNMNL